MCSLTKITAAKETVKPINVHLEKSENFCLNCNVSPILLKWIFEILVNKDWGKPEYSEKNPQGMVHQNVYL